jgi:hypothetical protein
LSPPHPRSIDHSVPSWAHVSECESMPCECCVACKCTCV